MPAESLLERDRELAEIAAAVGRASGGDGGIVLVEGPAGIGKTRLLGEARRRASAAGMRVLTARGSEIEREFAFGVVRQLMEGLVVDPAVAERAFGGAAGGARPIFAAVEGPAGEGDASFAALHGLFWLVVNLSGDGPLMLVVDDLHWADRSSLRFVAYLAGRLEALPVCVVAGLRTAEPGTDPALVAEITRDPATVVVRPGPLSAEATTALIEQRAGEAADPQFVAACQRATLGNPLLLTELLRALRSEGVALDARHADAVAGIGSRAVSRAVLARLSRLSPEAVAVTWALAVLGDGADLRTVAEQADVDPAAAAAATGELARAEILTPDPPLAFVHPLVRDAVYTDIPPGERERLHERAAGLLAAAGAPDERLAAHVVLAPRAGDPRAVEILRRAARTASARGAPDSAATYLRRALEEPPPAADRADVLYDLGRVEVMVSGPDAAAHLAAAGEALVDPRKRAVAAYELARTMLFTGRQDEALAIAGRTREELPEELGDERRRLLAMEHMTTFFGAGDGERRRELEAWRAPPDDSDPGTRLLMAMAALEWAITGGSAEETTAVALRALEGGVLTEVDDNLIFVAAAMIPCLADRPEALDVWDELLARAHRKGSLVGALTVHLWRGYALLRRGEMEEAETSVRRSWEEMEAWGSPPSLLAYPAALLADLLVERGDLAGARRMVDILGVPPMADVARLLLGARLRVMQADGRHEEVVALAREYVERFPRVVNPAWAPWAPFAAEALDRLGRREEALVMIDDEIGRCRSWGGAGALGRALRVRGQIAREEGLGALEQSVAVLDGSPARLELAKSLVALGTALRLARRPTDAREPLQRGLALALACGVPPLADRARAELQAAGVRPRAESGSGVGALTASERRVADLATEGHTNKDIAQLLFVTPKTIEVHLSSVYRKLGIRSRRDLARALAPA